MSEGPVRFEIAQEMQSMAEASFDRVRKTFTKFRTSAATDRWNSRETG